MTFLSYTKKEKITLLIDIGSGTISVAIASFVNKTPNFLYHKKDSFSIDEKPSSTKFLLKLESLLDHLVSDALQSGQWEIVSVGVSFSSPWYIFKTKELVLNESKFFIITNKFLESIAVNEENLYKAELSEENEKPREKFSVIEKYIVHAKINGYSVSSMLGKKTKNFHAYLYISAIPKVVEDKVVNVISRQTHIQGKKLLLQTVPMVSFAVVRDYLTQDSSFMLMDISGELTDISIVNEGAITQNASFPLGRNYLIRRLAKVSKSTNEIAESMLHMYIEQKTDIQTTEFIEKVLNDIENEWAVYFENFFQTFFKDMVFPNKVFITAEEDFISIFENFLKLDKLDITSTFRKNVSIVRVDRKNLATFCSSLPSVNPDEFIIILALFYSKMKNDNSDLV